MKKILSSLVLIAVLLSACFIGTMPASAAAINYDDFDVYDGVLVEYIGDGGDVVIPSTDRDGNPITEIDANAFHKNEDIVSVVIPEGITKIGKEAFEECTYLQSVKLPYSLTEMDYSAFRKCASLTTIVIPASLKEIPSDCFAGCTSLTDITISYGVTKIGSYAFSAVSASEIAIPKTVSEINGYAFYNLANADKRVKIYLSNGMCDLGFYKDKSNKTSKEAVFGSPDHVKALIEVYVPDGSGAHQALLKAPQNAYSGLTVNPQAQADLDARPENQPDYGMQGPAKVENPTDVPNKGDDTGNEDGQKDNDKDGKDDSDLGNILLIIGIAFGALILILIVAIVIVVVVKNNKKKKKAAEKAARRAAKAAAAAQVTEEATENVSDDAE